mmetsp:Transcript_2226/g.4399  ORF Transcript_2226/g.4399 Transcript_2226/m.4399 type:complete len:283 (-) Transcript_2226:89-937(-)
MVYSNDLINQPTQSTEEDRKQYYAVRKGKAVRACIFLFWCDCKEQVDGYDGAEYAIFRDISAAVNFAVRPASAILRASSKSLPIIASKPDIPPMLPPAAVDFGHINSAKGSLESLLVEKRHNACGVGTPSDPAASATRYPSEKNRENISSTHHFSDAKCLSKNEKESYSERGGKNTLQDEIIDRDSVNIGASNEHNETRESVSGSSEVFDKDSKCREKRKLAADAQQRLEESSRKLEERKRFKYTNSGKKQPRERRQHTYGKRERIRKKCRCKTKKELDGRL